MAPRKPGGPRRTRAAGGKAAAAGDATAAELRRERDLLRSLAEASPVGITVVDRDGRITFANLRAERILGLTEDRVTARRYNSPEWRITAHDGGPFPDSELPFQRVMATGGPVFGVRHAIEWPDGRRVLLSINAAPLLDAAEQVAGMVATIEDVTDRRRAEEIQRATFAISEAALAAPDLQELYADIHRIISGLMPARNFYIALYDPRSDLLTFPYFVDEVDPTPEPVPLGKGLTEYVLRTGQPLLATPEVWEDLTRRGEAELVGAPSVDWLGVPLVTGGRTIGVLVVQTYAEGLRYGRTELDILRFVSTQVAMAIERKRAEDAVRASDAFHRQAIENADGVPFQLIFGPTIGEGRYRNVGAGMERLLGLKPSEFTEKRFYEMVEEIIPLSPGMPADPGECRRMYLEGEIPHYRADVRVRTATGQRRWIRDSSLPLRDPKTGRVIGALGILLEITEHKRLEEQLRQAQKMEAVGRLAGGVAHDFNNLLTAIRGYSDLLLADLGPADPRRADVEEIKKATERAAELTRQLLAFSRRQVLQPKVIDLNAVVAGTERLLRRLIGEPIRLVTRLDPALGAVRADAGQVEQLLVNLGVNARDAMPEGGTLSVETGNVAIGPAPPTSEQAPMPPGRYVELRVRDTGVGMDPETKSHLFEPFFTTREKGLGTGLGLSTVYGIVKQSGGFIWVDSEEGRGTTFTVQFPLVEERVEPAETVRAAAPDVGGTETVLVVEDEAAVRAVACESLRVRGYAVLEAADGEAALRVAAGAARPVDLLLTDVVMPGISGRALADRLLAERPDLRVLYMSGYTDDALGQHGVLDPGLHYLQKPFTPETLARKVREVLDEGA